MRRLVLRVIVVELEEVSAGWAVVSVGASVTSVVVVPVVAGVAGAVYCAGAEVAGSDETSGFVWFV